MTLIPLSSLSRLERALLGVNILAAGRGERRPRHRWRTRGFRRARRRGYTRRDLRAA